MHGSVAGAALADLGRVDISGRKTQFPQKFQKAERAAPLRPKDQAKAIMPTEAAQRAHPASQNESRVPLAEEAQVGGSDVSAGIPTVLDIFGSGPADRAEDNARVGGLGGLVVVFDRGLCDGAATGQIVAVAGFEKAEAERRVSEVVFAEKRDSRVVERIRNAAEEGNFAGCCDGVAGLELVGYGSDRKGPEARVSA